MFRFLLLCASSCTKTGPQGPAGSNGAVQGLTWRLMQDATGSRTLAYGTMFKFLNSTAPTLSTAPNAVDILQGIYDPIDNVIYASMLLNFG